MTGKICQADSFFGIFENFDDVFDEAIAIGKLALVF
jgi:hypothetical protein